MKKRIYQVSVLAAGSLALSAVVHGGPVQDAIVDSAMTGGAIWATATASLANIGQLLSVQDY